MKNKLKDLYRYYRYNNIIKRVADMVMKAKNKGIVPKYWYNIVPYIKNELRLKVLPLLDPKTGKEVNVESLSRMIPTELVKQELNFGIYSKESKIKIPKEIFDLYCTYRPTPLIRAKKLEKHLGLSKVKIFYKREDANIIGSYKLNSSYPQAYYATKDGIKIFVADTGPGNWGMGMALACKKFNIPAMIFMEKKNYDAKIKKVKAMEKLGAEVIPIETKQGTIAASISRALEIVMLHPKNKLCLGCLTAYSALHNTIIGTELDKQLDQLKIKPNAFISVVGGGSSFSGFVFPLIKKYKDTAEFIAVESKSVPSFSKGKYRYENPDLVGLMPRAKMYTLGNDFVPKNLGASGLNYHGKNPLLSLLVNQKVIKTEAYSHDEVDPIQEMFQKVEGIRPAAESCYAIKGAIEKAKEWNGQDKTIVFVLTGNDENLNIYSENAS